jgi:hypothetical protein
MGQVAACQGELNIRVLSRLTNLAGSRIKSRRCCRYTGVQPQATGKNPIGGAVTVERQAEAEE